MGSIYFVAWRIFGCRTRKGVSAMSTGALFGFGCVIFFTVMTGVFLWGLETVKAIAERDK
jgi:hypothetical protein